ncbi:MAG TPA: acetyl-CoA hydrolase/transferase C-terminal domain-containing protein [Syntrophales bacterium]|nr:acetyl-CoA hydrolase/transferase C-terminal domain-containing protein [Syntrophales bacterium]
MDWRQVYKSKLLSVEEAASKIESGDRIWMTPCSGAPIQMVEALADRVNELKDVHIVTGLVLHPFKFLKSPEYIGRINFHTIFMGPYERAFFKIGNVNVNSVNFSKTYIAMRDYYRINVLLADVSPPDDDGFLHYGALGAGWNGTAEAQAEKIIVQVNKYQPKVRGYEHKVHVSKVTHICEFDHELPPLPQPTPTEVDKKIAALLADQIPDGAAIQIGVGGLSNAIGYFLTGRKNLSIYTEMFVDSMLDLIKKGIVTGKIVAGFGLGSVELYDFMADERVELRPVRVINDPSEIAKVDNLISINVTLMVDLTGQSCSESLGFAQYSCTGGQSDFTRGAALSKGGKGFLCLPSTIETKDGKKTSTITASFPPGAVVTTQRSDVMYVVTEYGIADLYCKPITARVNELIGIAHPDFREGLRKQAIEAGLIRA